MQRAMQTRSALSNRQPTARRSGRLRSQAGQTLLEVALLAPMLLALLVGTIEFGRYAYLGILVENAARAGAAYGAQSLPQSADTVGIRSAADNDFANGQNLTGLNVTPSTSCGCDNGGTVTGATCSTAVNPSAGTCASGHWVVMVSVQASATFNPLFGFPGISKSITVTRTVTMRVDQT
jgi:Flp pilus assembly protein TadG